MLLLLGITAGFGGVRPSVSDGSEPDTVSSLELDSLASFFAGVQSYLTDAVSHRPDTLSNFIYVDLADR